MSNPANCNKPAIVTFAKLLRLLSLSLVMLTGAVTAKAQVNTEQVINVGRNAMYFEDYVLSIQYFNQAINAKPYLAWPYLYRAIAKLNLDDFRGAEADATLAIERNPYITDAWEVRGVARQNQGNNRGAVGDYEHALSLIPHNRQISFNLATAMTEAGMYDKADSTFTSLLESYPRFDNGLLGRARLRIASADTVAAEADIRKALEINPKSFNAHAMLSDLAMRGDNANLDTAKVHLDAAIRLQPHIAGLYVNRAYLKYRKNDWFGAMDDYDYALQLEPLNGMALYNRGLLEMETSAFDRALEDFNKVLEINPDDTRAHYNRAIIHSSKHNFRKAIEDIDHVIGAFPQFPNGYLMRSEFYRHLGNNKKAMADYEHGMKLLRNLQPADLPVFDKPAVSDDSETGTADADTGTTPSKDSDDKAHKANDLLAQRQFAALLTVPDNTDFRQEYNNSAIRGRVQDRNVAIETEPMVELSFYSSPTEVRPNTFYIKEVNDLNATRSLRMTLVVTTHAPRLTDQELIDRHFKSIDYYNSYIATHAPRAVDYIGRAMDFMTVHDYEHAVSDLNRALELTPDFAAAYLMRAQANWRLIETLDATSQPDKARPMRERALSDAVLADLDSVIRLSPNSPYAYYNKGNVLLKRGDMPGASEAYTKAIELKPDFAEAYFNRGYVALSSGSRRNGLNDLSRAGELGIVAAYNLMKRLGEF